MKKNTLEQRLRELTDEELVQLILTVSDRDDAVRKLFTSLTAPATTQIKTIRRAIQRLGKAPSGYRYIRSREMVGMIGDVLVQIDAATERSPADGWVLLCELMAVEEAIHAHVDDSSGMVGSEYHSEIIPRLVRLSQTLTDPKPLTEGLRILCRNDAFGTVASALFEIACYLPDPVVEAIHSDLASRPLASEKLGGYRYDANVNMRQALYRSTGDVQAFIELSESTVGLSEEDYVRLAEIKLDNADVQGAQEFLDKVSKHTRTHSLAARTIYHRYLKMSGNSTAHKEHLRALFVDANDVDALREYRDRFGNDALQSVLDLVLQTVTDGETGLFPDTAATLLVLLAGGRAADVARLVGSTAFRDRLRLLRGHTGNWDRTAYELSSAGFHVEGSLIIRSLLTTVMAQAKVSTYRYAATLFRSLDLEAEHVSDWGPHEHHDDFMARFAETHARKYKFWEHIPV